MTGDRDALATRIPADVNKQFTWQEPRDDAATKEDVRQNPFDWRDLFFFVMPIAVIVLSMWWDAPS